MHKTKFKLIILTNVLLFRINLHTFVASQLQRKIFSIAEVMKKLAIALLS
jgi:hypothetical protein